MSNFCTWLENFMFSCYYNWHLTQGISFLTTCHRFYNVIICSNVHYLFLNCHKESYCNWWFELLVMPKHNVSRKKQLWNFKIGTSLEEGIVWRIGNIFYELIQNLKVCNFIQRSMPYTIWNIAKSLNQVEIFFFAF